MVFSQQQLRLVQFTFAIVLSSSLGVSMAFAGGDQCESIFVSTKSKRQIGVSEDFVAKMQSRRRSAADKMLQKFTTEKGLAAPMNTSPKHDNNYSFELPEGTIKDQQRSGRCWIFASLTAIENFYLGKGNLMPDAEFSRTYLQFFNMLERSSSHLEKVIDLRRNSQRISSSTILQRIAPKIADGGYVEDIIFLIKKYGLVTTSAMPETLNSLNTDLLLAELNSYLQVKSYEMWNLSENFDSEARALHDRIVRGQAENTTKYDKVSLQALSEAQLQILEAKKEEILGGVWLILEKALGTPPKTFTAKVPVTNPKTGVAQTKIRKFEPQKFVTDYMKFNPEDWINVSNLRNRPRDQVYQVKYQDMNRVIRRLNLDPVRMMNLVKAQLKAGMPVPFDSNFGPGVNRKTGDMEPGTDDLKGMFPYKQGQAPRRLSKSELDILGILTADHETVFMGYDQPEGYANPIKFKVENSWSDQYGNGGNFNLSAQWFDLYVDGIMIHKSMLSPEELAIFNGKPIILKATNE